MQEDNTVGIRIGSRTETESGERVNTAELHPCSDRTESISRERVNTDELKPCNDRTWAISRDRVGV
eukprot:9218104-Karenia_brevis.AAC.1